MAARKIFQSSPLVEKIIEQVCIENNLSVSDVVNDAVMDYYLPLNPALKKISSSLFSELLSGSTASEASLKRCISQSIEVLGAHPIEDCHTLESIFEHFVRPAVYERRFDYVQIVDDIQDEKLMRLNKIIKTLDPEYELGTRELGLRTRKLFPHWKEICEYPEVYSALSTIIQCEKIYTPLSICKTLQFIRQLDREIYASTLVPKRESYPTNVSINDMYYAYRYMIVAYESDNAYASLTGDQDCSHMPEDIAKFIQELSLDYPFKTDISEEDLQEIMKLERKGRILFRWLRPTRKENK